MANAARSSVVFGVLLGALAGYGTLRWRESENAAVAQARAHVQALQAQWRDAQQTANARLAQGDDPAHQQQLLAEVSAAGQAKQVRDDLLSLLALAQPGLNWQGLQLNRQGVWQLQLRADNQSAVELWHQQIKQAGLDGVQWVQLARSATTLAGKGGPSPAQAPASLLLTLRAPLGQFTAPPHVLGEPL